MRHAILMVSGMLVVWIILWLFALGGDPEAARRARLRADLRRRMGR